MRQAKPWTINTVMSGYYQAWHHGRTAWQEVKSAYVLQTVTGEDLSVLKEALVELWATKIWVNSLVKPVLKASNRERLHIVRVLVQAWQELPVRITNVSSWDQVQAEDTTLGHWESVAWAARVNGLKLQTLGLCEQLQELVSSANNINTGGARSANPWIPGYFLNEEWWIWVERLEFTTIMTMAMLI
jgi:hypothetical protein